MKGPRASNPAVERDLEGAPGVLRRCAALCATREGIRERVRGGCGFRESATGFERRGGWYRRGGSRSGWGEGRGEGRERERR